MKKQLLITMLIACLLATVVPLTAFAQTPIKVIVNGKTLTLDAAPVIENGRTLVPLRGIFEALQATVDWDSYTKTVTSQRGEVAIRLQIGNQHALKNGQQVTLDAPAKIIHSRTFVPLRFVGESFGASVVWDAKARTVTIGAKEVATPKKKLTVQEVAKKSDAVVLIEVFDKAGNFFGSGSGFIISSSGRVVTNYHVIDAAYSAEVITDDNKKYKVSGILDYNIDRDIAVLQLEKAASLPTVSLGDSSKVKVGDEVVAIGSPLNLQNTVTTGIISSIRNYDGYSYFQTSASYTYGSSGGALFDLYGDVIGVTSQGFDGQNLNFAIPINDVKPLLKATKVKTFLEVIKEAYPPLSYEEFEEYLFDDYCCMQVEGYLFSFDDILVEDGEKPNQLDIYLQMNKESYAIFDKAMKQGRYKPDVEDWLYFIGKEAELRYQNKVIYGYLYLYDEYDQYPTGFNSNEVKFNSTTGKYEVMVPLVFFDTEDDLFGFYWMKEYGK